LNTRIPLALAFFLILLRLAIGWHFYVEGAKKVKSLQDEKSLTNQPFSSAEYLRGSTGPLADLFRKQAGDPDAEALARLDVRSPDADQADGKKNYRHLLPPALDKHYDDYFNRFVKHLDLGDSKVTVRRKIDVPLWGELWVIDEEEAGKGQLDLARARLDQAKEYAARWLLGLDKDATVEVSLPLFKTGPALVKRTPPERIEAYKSKLAEIRAVQREELPSFEKPVRKDLPALKKEAAEMRTDLMRDLDRILTTRLEEVLTDKQQAQLKADPVPAAPVSKLLWWTDRVVSWSLLIIGGCLLLGLFTRMACVAGALFLLTTYIVLPPFLGVPVNAHQEGFYYLVNKNLIEMLALLALAVTPSGRWLGLDSVLCHLNPFRKRPRPPQPANTPTPPKK
jgi:uncharacterized membrane protein YphA (DoxX/SURF4 family)